MKCTRFCHAVHVSWQVGGRSWLFSWLVLLYLPCSSCEVLAVHVQPAGRRLQTEVSTSTAPVTQPALARDMSLSHMTFAENQWFVQTATFSVKYVRPACTHAS